MSVAWTDWIWIGMATTYVAIAWMLTMWAMEERR